MLLDEIEKAHPDIYNILLAGHGSRDADRQQRPQERLPQRHPDHVEQRRQPRDGARARSASAIRSPTSKDGKKALERVFTPEFRNRLDATVMFGALPLEMIRKVARKFLDELDGQLDEKKVELEVTDAAIDWFVEHGYDKAMGARPMARLVQTTLKAPLANEILFGKLRVGGIAHDRRRRTAQIAIDVRSRRSPRTEANSDVPSGAMVDETTTRGTRAAPGDATADGTHAGRRAGPDRTTATNEPRPSCRRWGATHVRIAAGPGLPARRADRPRRHGRGRGRAGSAHRARGRDQADPRADAVARCGRRGSCARRGSRRGSITRRSCRSTSSAPTPRAARTSR